MIKVLVVEDSFTASELLIAMLESDPGIKVAGRVTNGKEAIEFLQRCSVQNKPNIITMDIEMPVMDGIEATRVIMETAPMPIVVVSAAWKPSEAALTFRAMEAGALSIIEKPRGPRSPEYETQARKLIQTVKLMAEIKVVRRRAKALQAQAAGQSYGPTAPRSPLSPFADSPLAASPASVSAAQLVLIGASTGGPPALKTILNGLPADFALPILIVQHITEGFLDGMARWLGETSSLPIHVATNGEKPLPGHVYLAADGAHLAVGTSGNLRLDDTPPENGSRPSVSHLFRSVAESKLNAIAVLLTGMGRDGARELKLLRDHGCLTIAQDKESSIIHGMPGEAISLGAAMRVLPIGEVAAALVTATRKRA